VGVHGQTVRHRPELGYTIQLNAPALLAELCGIDVVADFRSRDVAAGGQGAPLVPAFHAAVFGTTHPRGVLNLGGFANLSVLPALAGGPSAGVRGFDTGPGNVLLDHWTWQTLGERFDRDGAWAASGRVDEALVSALLDDAYFDRVPPKSTGRDHFNGAWLDAVLKRVPGAARRPADVQASLAELTARSVAADWQRHGTAGGDLVVCGGGARNGDLLRRLAAALPGARVQSCAALGVAPEQVEALAFAWLARAHVRGLPGNLPEVTGAAGLRVLGTLTPAQARSVATHTD
jgi:anhydro-N-acetylmuramic acid kinase